MDQPKLEIPCNSKRPRLLNIHSARASDKGSVFSTRSSVDLTFQFPPRRSDTSLVSITIPKPCGACTELKTQIEELKKNLNQERTSKKYLSQLSCVLEIKENRLKEEEKILQLNKENFLLEQKNFSNFCEIKKQKIKDTLTQLKQDKKELEAKKQEFSQSIFDFSQDKKTIKQKIKSKINEKFSLRESIILRSQKDLQAREDALSLKLKEKETCLSSQMCFPQTKRHLSLSLCPQQPFHIPPSLSPLSLMISELESSLFLLKQKENDLNFKLSFLSPLSFQLISKLSHTNSLDVSLSEFSSLLSTQSSELRSVFLQLSKKLDQVES